MLMANPKELMAHVLYADGIWYAWAADGKPMAADGFWKSFLMLMALMWDADGLSTHRN